MDAGRDRAEDGDEAGDLDLRAAIEEVKSEGTRGDPEIADFLDEDAEGDDGSDVEALFEEFEEGSVEEVIAADEAEPEDAEGFREATDDDVENLFGDLSAVELDPEESGTGTDVEEAETGSGTGTGTTGSAPPDPEETAEEIEGLFDDLSGIEVPEGPEEGRSTGTARTQSTVLDTGDDGATFEDDASAFQWLGEDVHIFSAEEADVDEVFEGFDEASPEEVIASAESTPGVGATALYADLAAGRSPGSEDGAPTAPGWEPVAGADPDGVTAGDLYDDLGGTAPSVVGDAAGDPVAADAGAAGDERDGPDPLDLEAIDPEDDLDLDLEGDPEATPTAEGEATTETDAQQGASSPETADGSEASAGADPAATGTSLSGVTPDLDAAGVGESDPIEGEADVDAVFERFEESTPEEVIEAAAGPEAESGSVDDETVERLFGDLSGVELETGADGDGEVAAEAAGTGESDVEGLLGDLSGVEVDVGSDRGGEATAVTAETAVEPIRDPAGDVLERTGADTHVAVGEADVDAVFERFEEGSPEEVIDSVEATPEAGETDAAADPFAVEDEPEEMPAVDADEDGADEDAESEGSDGDDGSSGVLGRIKRALGGLLGR